MSGALPRDANVLVIAVARIGDTLLATPVMRALKQACPAGRLTVLAHPKRTDVLLHLPFIDRLGSIDKLRAVFRGRMPGRANHTAVVFGRDAALVSYALRAANRVVAFDEPDFPRDPRLTTVAPETGTHAVLERLRLAAVLGITASDRRLAWQVTPAEREAALKQRPRTRGPVVALQMVSFQTKPQRDWPVERFIELAHALVQHDPDTRFVVLGDEHARDASRPFIEIHGPRTLLAAGSTTLRETAALISVSDLYVGVDTGPTHIAGALGVAMVALYHRDYPGRNLMPLDHPRCRMLECEGAAMDTISVAEVRNAALAMLSAPPVAA